MKTIFICILSKTLCGNHLFSSLQIMPAILMGTFLPFILPVLKMATITTMIMNNTAFMAALIYAARQHVNSQDEQQINYSYGAHPGGYH